MQAVLAIYLLIGLLNPLLAQMGGMSFSLPCTTEVTYLLPDALKGEEEKISAKVNSILQKNNIFQGKETSTVLNVIVEAKETAAVEGLSKAGSMVKGELILRFKLVDQRDKELIVVEKKGRGMGSTLAAVVVKALDNMNIQSEAGQLSGLIRGTGVVTKLRIAVLPFKSSGPVGNWLEISSQLSDMLITSLVNFKKFDVVERAQLEKIIEEKKLAMTGLTEQKDEIMVAAMAGAELMMVGSASIVGNKIEVDARIVDLKNGVAKWAGSSTGFTLDHLRMLADDLVKKIKI